MTTMFNYTTFGQNFRKCRESLNISRTEVCIALQINHSYLVQIETGKRKASSELIIGLVNYLNKTVDELMNGIDDKQLLIDGIIRKVEMLNIEEMELLHEVFAAINRQVE